MNEKSYASSDRAKCWSDINFTKAEAHVKKLQQRIFNACYYAEYDKLDSLSHMMIHSFYAKALAVKHVCSTHGKHTPGVDNIIWESDDEKFNAIFGLHRRGYKASPLKRAYIKKTDGRTRLLGIPTMQDRAMQSLYAFALEPIAECLADDHSYGFRPKRCAQDAVDYVIKYLAKSNPQWVLKADIRSCFDNISHDWLLKNVPMDKMILRTFLECGYMSHDTIYPTRHGVPQGGCLSNILCNLTLDGLEHTLLQNVDAKMAFVRYADDIIIFADTSGLLGQAVLPVVEKYLSERGLSLSNEKSGIFSVKEGFYYLGWHIYKSNNQIIAVPSRQAVDTLLEKTMAIVSQEHCFSDKELLNRLKSVIWGWLNYYKTATPPVLNGIEFEVISNVYQLTGSPLLIKNIENIFHLYYIKRFE